MRFNKYKAIKTDGYDSKKESRRAAELKLLEKARVITHLVEQPEFELQPTFKDNQGKTERAIKYRGDFGYFENGQHIIEDCKGFRTEKYLIKKKLFKFKFPGIIFRET